MFEYNFILTFLIACLLSLHINIKIYASKAIDLDSNNNMGWQEPL